VDFTAYRIRRNPYAARIAREGVEIAHDGPSRKSLREMPEAVWKVLENEARARATSVHALLREIVLTHLTHS
jgi:hypothetical protein